MSRARYYRRDGTPIREMLTWARLFDNPEYSRVAETILEDGTRISTIWLGLDHNWFDQGPPIIFETVVFSGMPFHSPGIKAKDGMPGLRPYDYYEAMDQNRYSTEAEAIAGHDVLVRKWRGIREAWKKAGGTFTTEGTKPGRAHLN